MSTSKFYSMLDAQWSQGKSLCIGLDSKFSNIPACVHVIGRGGTVDRGKTMAAFNRRLIETTYDIAGAYKPNYAFYMAQGMYGLESLQETFEDMRRLAPGVPGILDCKDADIGNTAKEYGEAVFDVIGADAMTTNPYLGSEALLPLLERRDKGIIVLCRTSNGGAGEFQDLIIEGTNRPLYQVVADRVASHWNRHGNCGVVVGATYPSELGDVREIVGDMPILIPGIGTQGGDLKKTVAAAKLEGGRGMIINASRSIIFASSEPDFADAARREAQKLDDEIRACL